MGLKKYTLFLFLLGGIFISCSKDDVPKPPSGKERTFFLYLAADNSLGQNQLDYPNIESLVSAVKPAHLVGANIIIYHDPKIKSGDRTDNKPRLLEIAIGDNGKAATKEVRIYDEQNSGSVEVFKQIMDEVISTYPAEKYSLLMWSHGSGWLPGVPDFSTKAIGQDDRDSNSWIEIDELAEAIPDGQFDYIIFDACHMTYVEVAYALRNKTEHIIGSTIEIMGWGMNYDKMPDLLLSKNPDYEAFCKAFYDTYNANYGCTISVINTAGLDELALTVKDILKDIDVERDIINGLASESLQRFGRLSSYLYSYFDLGDFMEQVSTPAQYSTFRDALNKTVEVNLYSDSFRLSAPFVYIRKHSGLGCYIPRQYPKINEYYQTMEWYKAVYP